MVQNHPKSDPPDAETLLCFDHSLAPSGDPFCMNQHDQYHHSPQKVWKSKLQQDPDPNPRPPDLAWRPLLFRLHFEQAALAVSRIVDNKSDQNHRGFVGFWMTRLFPCVEGLILPTIDHDFWIKPDTFRVTNTHSKSVQPNNVSFVDIPRHFYLLWTVCTWERKIISMSQVCDSNKNLIQCYPMIVATSTQDSPLRPCHLQSRGQRHVDSEIMPHRPELSLQVSQVICQNAIWKRRLTLTSFHMFSTSEWILSLAVDF